MPTPAPMPALAPVDRPPLLLPVWTGGAVDGEGAGAVTVTFSMILITRGGGLGEAVI